MTMCNAMLAIFSANSCSERAPAAQQRHAAAGSFGRDGSRENHPRGGSSCRRFRVNHLSPLPINPIIREDSRRSLCVIGLRHRWPWDWPRPLRMRTTSTGWWAPRPLLPPLPPPLPPPAATITWPPPRLPSRHRRPFLATTTTPSPLVTTMPMTIKTSANPVTLLEIFV